MTLGEISRYVNGFVEREERANKQRASFDYLLATTIIKGVSVVMSGGTMPTIYEVYPDVFEKELKQQSTQRSVANFVAFANSWNNKYKEKHNDTRRDESSNNCGNL